jgi:glycine hydroxymethyltransferase
MLKRFFSKQKGIIFMDYRQDKELYGILQNETKLQTESLQLIASENFTSRATLQYNGSIFTNRYAEGYPGKRYYGGCKNIDELETLCQKRALRAFNANPEQWGVNVQAYSGSPANFAVYTALLKPGDKLMGLALPSGGHLTHGFETPTKKISASSIFFKSRPYHVDPKTYLIDYDQLENDVLEFKPQLLIVGASAYVRDYNYAEFRRIADLVGAKLMADIAHTSGLVASGFLNSPFNFADVVTTTTHKTLRGPRAALIFYKKELKERIDFAVFPGINGGGHFNTISAIATALRQVATGSFRNYSRAVIENAVHLSDKLESHGFHIITGGTDNHIVMINVKKNGITGSKFEKLAELCNVSVNKNMIATDTSALSPSGIRLGTPAMTTRGFTTKEFDIVVDILKCILDLGLQIQTTAPSNKLVDFAKECDNYQADILIILQRVKKLCKHFPLPH